MVIQNEMMKLRMKTNEWWMFFFVVFFVFFVCMEGEEEVELDEE